jgi:hypothetical protein
MFSSRMLRARRHPSSHQSATLFAMIKDAVLATVIALAAVYLAKMIILALNLF